VPEGIMPVQVLIFLLAIVVIGLCARYWRIFAAIAAALIITAGLVALNVIVDVRVLHHLIGYVLEVRHYLGGLGQPP
jgi:hypothetical protein